MKKLTAKQILALPLLASGESGVETAKIINVKPSTISEWLNHHVEFIQALDELRDAGIRQAVMQLQNTVTTAVEELRRIMTSSKTDALRLKAAQFIIETYGVLPAQNESNLDPETNAELIVIRKVLNVLGISHGA